MLSGYLAGPTAGVLAAAPRLQVGTPPATEPTPQVPVSSADVSAIARKLNCPVCQGYTLQDCPLQVCAQMRNLIRQRLAAGESEQQVVDAFVTEYGPQVLNAPPTRGFFLTAWVLPVVAFLVGAVGVVLFLRRPGKRPMQLPVEDGSSSPPTPPDAEAVARLERLAAEDQPGGGR
jgi:cytochrome c-type biogenesis protein CcmH